RFATICVKNIAVRRIDKRSKNMLETLEQTQSSATAKPAERSRSSATINTANIRSPSQANIMSLADEAIKLEVKNLNLFYDQKRALNDVNLVIPEKKVTAFI